MTFVLAIIGTPVTLTVPRFSKESPNIKLSYLRSAFVFRPSHHVFFSSLCCSSAETDAFKSQSCGIRHVAVPFAPLLFGLSRIYDVLQVSWLMHTKAMGTQLFDAPDDDKNNTHILQHTTCTAEWSKHKKRRFCWGQRSEHSHGSRVSISISECVPTNRFTNHVLATMSIPATPRDIPTCITVMHPSNTEGVITTHRVVSRPSLMQHIPSNADWSCATGNGHENLRPRRNHYLAVTSHSPPGSPPCINRWS